MRKYGIIVVFAGLIMGCASFGKGGSISSYAPVGIIYVASNHDINWHGEEPSTSDKSEYLMDNVFNRRREETATRISKADVLIDEADAMVREILSGSGIAEFAEKETLINARTYAEAEVNDRLERSGAVKAAGYRLINFRDKTFPGKLAQETGINSALYVTFTFTKVMASGIGKRGTMRAQVAMTALVIDTAGKTLYNKTQTLKSADKISVSGGFYDEEELMALFKTAISDACYDLAAVFTVKS
jgi:hypothetical protein